jgi:hypothetical protein
MNPELYTRAQKALAELKGTVRELLSEHPGGLPNHEIGRSLGIYSGHSGKHEGHISRTLLEALQHEGVVIQNPETKLWRLRSYSENTELS